MPKLSKHQLVRALLRQPIDYTPIWIMRQAGRYLPEYKVLRNQVPDFMSFCKNSELTALATLQPLKRFALDAAIVFSDILVIPEAMGMQLEFVNGEGPVIHNPIRCMADVHALRRVDVSEALVYVLKTIQLVMAELADSLPLIGFAGSPWTCATYMIEGHGSKTFDTVKHMLYSQPDIIHALLERLTHITIEYLQAQISAGVQVVMLFDTWGGILAHKEYKQFSLEYMQQIAADLQRNINGQTVPLIFFTKGGSNWLEQIAESGCDAIGLDWTIDITQAEKRVGQQVSLQGNMDPAILFAAPQRIEQEARLILESFRGASGHVFNLGHGISQYTPIENVNVLVNAVHRLSSRHIPQFASENS